MANGILNLENSGMTAGGGFLLGKIEWSAAASEAENASSVTAALYVKKGGTATLATTGMWNARLTVAGETAAVQIAATVGTEWVKLAEKTVRAAHSASGSGSCALSGAVTGPQGTLYAARSTQGSGTAVLDTIARASVPSATAAGWKMGQSGCGIRTNRKSTKFYHRVRYAFGALSGQTAGLSKYDGVTDGATFVPPRSLAAEIPNALSGICTFTVTTYQDAAMTKQVGTPQTCTAQIYAADDMVPKITAFSVSAASDTVPREWGLWVQGQTCAAWSAAAEAGEGAAIASYAFSMGSAAGSGASGKTAPLPAGALVPKLTVRDTRGRSAVKSLEAVTVEPYSLPALSACSALRCDSDGTEHAEGTHIRLSCTAAHTPLGGHNALALRWRSRTADTEFGDWQPLHSGLVAADFAADASYEIVFSALDTLGGEKRVSLTLPVAAATVHLKSGGRGIGVGKFAEREDLLDIAWDTNIGGALTLGTPLAIEDGGTGAATAAQARRNLGAAADILETLTIPMAEQTSYTVNWLYAYARSGAVDLHLSITPIVSATSWITVATLPTGYRPPQNIYKDMPYWNAAAGNANLRMRITTGGAIQLNRGSADVSYAFHDMFIMA